MGTKVAIVLAAAQVQRWRGDRLDKPDAWQDAIRSFGLAPPDAHAVVNAERRQRGA
jgi:hypothetical protein